MQRFTAFVLTFFALTLAVYVLSTASSFFIPLVIAIVIAYTLIAIAEGLSRISIRGWQPPRFLTYLGVVAILFFAIWIVVTIVTNNVSALVNTAPVYQEKLNNLIERTYAWIGDKPPDISVAFEDFDFVSMIGNIAFMLTEVAGYAGMIAVYVLFLLIEYQLFDEKLNAIFQSEHTRKSTRAVIRKIGTQVQSYLGLKTIFSATTAGLSYLVLIIVGVDFAPFWALLIFLLNYIPTIGSIIATVFPCLLTLLQFDSLIPFVIVAVLLTLIQFVVGNIFEPRIVGKKFNLSPLVILLSLVVWGQIWGIIGMFLCVPFMMIISIVLANFTETRPISILLSQSGKLE